MARMVCGWITAKESARKREMTHAPRAPNTRHAFRIRRKLRGV
jgi:hypothetical protein